jgi:hypothetical protein
MHGRRSWTRRPSIATDISSHAERPLRAGLLVDPAAAAERASVRGAAAVGEPLRRVRPRAASGAAPRPCKRDRDLPRQLATGRALARGPARQIESPASPSAGAGATSITGRTRHRTRAEELQHAPARRDREIARTGVGIRTRRLPHTQQRHIELLCGRRRPRRNSVHHGTGESRSFIPVSPSVGASWLSASRSAAVQRPAMSPRARGMSPSK